MRPAFTTVQTDVLKTSQLNQFCFLIQAKFSYRAGYEKEMITWYTLL